MSGGGTPAGWYPDPQNPAQQRYWDGTAWSEATQPAPFGGPPSPGAYSAPVGYGMAQAGAAPSNHLAFAIIATVLCGCLGGLLPLLPGIASIVFASQVNSKWQAGDVAGAQDASSKARNFAIACVVVSVVWTVILISTGWVDTSFEFESN
jgi:hypothetical protein